MSAYFETLLASAHEAYQSGQYAEAEAPLKLMFGGGWRDGFIAYFIGHLEFLLGNAETALIWLDAAVAMQPDHARTHNDRGEVLRILGRQEEAVASLLRSIELEPELAYPYGNLGAALHALNRDEEALVWLEQALDLAADRAIAHCDLGATLAWLNRHEEAIQQYRLAQQVQPDYPRARHAESLSLLTLGAFREGWEKHEARLRDSLIAHSRRSSTEPAWDGNTDIAGRTILLHAEQGFGDSLQFIRYVPHVASRGATVVLQAQAVLCGLFTSVPGISTILTPDQEPPPFDLQCSLMSLPYALRDTIQAIPAEVPYLAVDPAHVENWRQRLGPQQRMRVGIAWAGNPRHANDRNRSIPFAMLARLLSRRDIDFHVLQAGMSDADRIALAELPWLHDHSATLHDFMDTAALATLMDLVITVDTALAHLAGALARPTWVLVPWSADWRWMLDRGDSPWYPTMRLFRQQRKGDWPAVLAEIERGLP